MKKRNNQRADSKTGQRFGNRLGFESLEVRNLLAADVGISDPFVADAVTLDDVATRASQESFMPGELIVATRVPTAKTLAESYLAGIDWADATGLDQAKARQTLMTTEQGDGQSVSIVHVDLGAGSDVMAAVEQLEGQADVLWSTPNFVYSDGDPREFTPNDPSFSSQYHHPLMGNVDAWDISLGDSSILIGITDDGVDLQHEDLQSGIWVNPGEIAGDGIDNDDNGYVDDVNGYNFLDGNNNPDALSGNDHGTHVAGIAAGSINNSTGIAGTAGGATIVPLKWYNGGTWTASIIASTFTYAADNGVNIVNTSYNMDGWANDPVVHAAFDYMYDAGVLHFNSAGNGSAFNPARQVFVESLLTVSTNSADQKAGSSNWGDGVDISAPGDSILSTTPSNTYSTFSGTSMAAPNASGVAALVWSANPTWTRDQVAAQVLGTADNIDSANPSFAGLMGAGRVNSFSALSQTLAPPQVTSLVGLPDDGGVLTGELSGFDIRFDQVMDPASVNDVSNFVLAGAGFDNVFGTSDDVSVGMSTSDVYKIGSNEFHVDIDAGNLKFGNYRLTVVSGGTQNPFATPLDGDGDGVGGDNFVSHFTVLPPAPYAVLPLGSLIYRQDFSSSVSEAGAVDRFAVEVDAGQTISIIVDGHDTLTPHVTIEDSDGNLVASAAAVGSSAVAQSVGVVDGGRYVVSVDGGPDDTVGSYDLSVVLNAGAELESLNASQNDTLATAQDLEATSIALDARLGEADGADRLAIVGLLPAAEGVVAYGEDFESGSLDSSWTTSTSSAAGRIEVSNRQIAADGQYSLLMDVSVDSNYSLNEAIWSVDMAGIASPFLRFSHAEWADELDALPQTFTGSFNGDGVSISDDGVTWWRVFAPTPQPAGEWQAQTIDLQAAATAAGMTLNSDFQVKFQQYDNFSLDTDGRGYDEIAITTSAMVNDDWYSFTLEDGQLATVGATLFRPTPGASELQMELYDAAGNLLASGAGSDNVTDIIEGYQDTTSNGAADTYYVKVSGIGGNYSLLVTRDAAFDTEANDSVATAQSLDGVEGVLGYVAGVSLAHAEPDNFVAGTVMDTEVPGVTLSNGVNGGSVYSAAASFGAPTGTSVLAPGPTSSAGWKAAENEFRADFDQPTNRVSIDVGSDDPSDVAFFRAYDASGTLLEQLISPNLSAGQSVTLTITRPTADISYILAAGVGTDITPLDNLQFEVNGKHDFYTTAVTAGQDVTFTAFLPSSGPYLFSNGLVGDDGSSDLVMDLIDPNGVVVASGVDSLSHVAATSGNYILEVSSAGGSGEYYIFAGSLVDIDGDFNDDGKYDCMDIDELVSQAVSGNDLAAYDLNGDLSVDALDVTAWLAEAGEDRWGPGRTYLPGDANLDGEVGVQDYALWNSNKFTLNAAWCAGDFNVDGEVGVSDYAIWIQNNFDLSLGAAIALDVPQHTTAPAADVAVRFGQTQSEQGQEAATAATKSWSVPAENDRPRVRQELDRDEPVVDQVRIAAADDWFAQL